MLESLISYNFLNIIFAIFFSSIQHLALIFVSMYLKELYFTFFCQIWYECVLGLEMYEIGNMFLGL